MNRLVLPLTFLLVCMAFAAWWFVGGGREKLRQTAAPPPAPAAVAPSPPEQPAKMAVEVTKRYRPVFGGRTIAERLDGIGATLLERGVDLKTRQWKASPVAEGDADAFEVTYALVGKGFDRQWSWTVKPGDGTVIPREPLAERVSGEEMEVAALIEELSPPPRPTPASTTLGKPTPAATQKPAGRPVAAPAPAPGAADASVDITLVGVVEGGGARRALLRQDGKVREARVGDRLGGGWTLAEIRVGTYGGSQVVVTRPGERRILSMAVATGPSAPPSAPRPQPAPGGPSDGPASAPPPGSAPLPPPPEPEPEGTPEERPSDEPASPAPSPP